MLSLVEQAGSSLRTCSSLDASVGWIVLVARIQDSRVEQVGCCWPEIRRMTRAPSCREWRFSGGRTLGRGLGKPTVCERGSAKNGMNSVPLDDDYNDDNNLGASRRRTGRCITLFQSIVHKCGGPIEPCKGGHVHVRHSKRCVAPRQRRSKRLESGTAKGGSGASTAPSSFGAVPRRKLAVKGAREGAPRVNPSLDGRSSASIATLRIANDRGAGCWWAP